MLAFTDIYIYLFILYVIFLSLFWYVQIIPKIISYLLKYFICQYQPKCLPEFLVHWNTIHIDAEFIRIHTHRHHLHIKIYGNWKRCVFCE